MEKPWIVVAPKQRKEDGIQETQKAKATSSETLMEVNNTLLNTIERLRIDDSKHGEYLTSLTGRMVPPDQLTEANDLHPRTHPYAVIDVVITAGKGAKYASGEGEYIAAPKMLKLKKAGAEFPGQGLKHETGKGVEQPSSLQTSPIPALDVPFASMRPRRRSAAIADIATPTSTSEVATTVKSNDEITPSSFTASSVDSEPPRKRRRTAATSSSVSAGVSTTNYFTEEEIAAAEATFTPTMGENAGVRYAGRGMVRQVGRKRRGWF